MEQHWKRWPDVVQIFYKCFVFAEKLDEWMPLRHFPKALAYIRTLVKERGISLIPELMHYPNKQRFGCQYSLRKLIRVISTYLSTLLVDDTELECGGEDVLVVADY